MPVVQHGLAKQQILPLHMYCMYTELSELCPSLQNGPRVQRKLPVSDCLSQVHN